MQRTTQGMEAEHDSVKSNQRPILKEKSIQTVVMRTLRRDATSGVADGATTGECKSKQIRLN